MQLLDGRNSKYSPGLRTESLSASHNLKVRQMKMGALTSNHSTGRKQYLPRCHGTVIVIEPFHHHMSISTASTWEVIIFSGPIILIPTTVQSYLQSQYNLQSQYKAY